MKSNNFYNNYKGIYHSDNSIFNGVQGKYFLAKGKNISDKGTLFPDI